MCFPKALQEEIQKRRNININSNTTAYITANYPNDIGKWGKHDCRPKSSLEDNNFLALYYCFCLTCCVSSAFLPLISYDCFFSSLLLALACVFGLGSRGECGGFLRLFLLLWPELLKHHLKTHFFNFIWLCFQHTHTFLVLLVILFHHILENWNEVYLVLNT